MKIELTKDLELVADVLQHPTLFNRITDDTGALLTRDELIQLLKEREHSTFYLKALDDHGKVQGVFECTELGDGSLEFHPNMLASGRGPFGAWAIKKVINLLFKHTDYKKLIVNIPSLRDDVFKFANAIGFKLEYMVEKGYTKNELEYDMYCLSLAKGI